MSRKATNQAPSGFKKWLPYLALALILAVYSGISAWRITDSFVTVSADTNGDSGVAVWNWLRYGPTALKFGLFPNWLSSDPTSIFGLFYVHHPVGFMFFVYLTYLTFGISEWSTRLGPMIFMIIGIIFFFFGLRKVFSDRLRPAFLTALAFVLLPGTIYYGKTFELSVFSLPAALITWSLFVFYRQKPNRLKLLGLLISVFIGGLMGWFYYFSAAAIAIALLFPHKQFKTSERYLLIIGIFGILILTASLHFLHSYTLNGPNSFSDLEGIFDKRVSRSTISFPDWLNQEWQIAAVNFTLATIPLAIIGLIFLIRFWQRTRTTPEFDLLPLLLFPILNTLVFYQWSTHPFGLIYFLPVIAVGTGYFLEQCFNKSFSLGLTLSIIAICLVSVFTLITLRDWYGSLILGREDIHAIKELKPQIASWDMCLGENTEGLSYSGILAWYLERPIQTSPHCLNNLKPRAVAFLFNPDFFRDNQKFYQERIQEFENQGFRKFRCITALCFYVRGDKKN